MRQAKLAGCCFFKITNDSVRTIIVYPRAELDQWLDIEHFLKKIANSANTFVPSHTSKCVSQTSGPPASVISVNKSRFNIRINAAALHLIIFPHFGSWGP